MQLFALDAKIQRYSSASLYPLVYVSSTHWTTIQYTYTYFFVAFISLAEAIHEFALNISIIVHDVRRTVEQHAEIPVDCCLSCVCSKKVVLLSVLVVAFT